MPDYVSNELTLTGSPRSLAAAMATLGDSTSTDPDRRILDFGRIVPMPPEVASRPSSSECLHGRHVDPMDRHCWAEVHWGTVRKASNVSMEGSVRGGVLRYEFSTAWTPAEPIVLAIGLRCPSLSIDYRYVETTSLVAGRIRHRPNGSWGRSVAEGDEASCKAVLGDSRLGGYLDLEEEAS